MSTDKCKTCKHYQPYPIVKMEGQCTDPSKIISVKGSAINEGPSVFDFSSCQNHTDKKN